MNDKSIGNISSVPLLGENFIIYASLGLVVFVVLNAMGIYNKLIGALKLRKFQFSPLYSENKVKEGKRLLIQGIHSQHELDVNYFFQLAKPSQCLIWTPKPLLPQHLLYQVNE